MVTTIRYRVRGTWLTGNIFYNGNDCVGYDEALTIAEDCMRNQGVGKVEIFKVRTVITTVKVFKTGRT